MNDSISPKQSKKFQHARQLALPAGASKDESFPRSSIQTKPSPTAFVLSFFKLCKTSFKLEKFKAGLRRVFTTSTTNFALSMAKSVSEEDSVSVLMAALLLIC